MSDAIILNATDPAVLRQIVPVPRVAVSVRVATMNDLPFLDALQKQHGRALGYFPTKQFQGYIEMGGVLVAEVGGSRSELGGRGDSPPTTHQPRPTPVGYIISRDRYLKRDELGVIYQLCVKPGDQRKLVGATLVREVFNRSAYGCRLYCCWCAQDLAANHFWESMGFVPIAFRAGSAGKRRVHIFWQRRINAKDLTTPYWYPCQTNSGAIREDRLVFPIPPGVHWTEVQAVALPSDRGSGILPERQEKTAPRKRADRRGSGETPRPRKDAPLGGFRFQADEPVKQPTPKRTRAAAKPKVAIDAILIARARELRDRCMERQDEWLALAPGGKYDISRALAAPVAKETMELPALLVA